MRGSATSPTVAEAESRAPKWLCWAVTRSLGRSPTAPPTVSYRKQLVITYLFRRRECRYFTSNVRLQPRCVSRIGGPRDWSRVSSCEALQRRLRNYPQPQPGLSIAPHRWVVDGIPQLPCFMLLQRATETKSWGKTWPQCGPAVAVGPRWVYTCLLHVVEWLIAEDCAYRMKWRRRSCLFSDALSLTGSRSPPAKLKVTCRAHVLSTADTKRLTPHCPPPPHHGPQPPTT